MSEMRSTAPPAPARTAGGVTQRSVVSEWSVALTTVPPKRQSSRRPCGGAHASVGGKELKPEPVTFTTVPPLVGPAGGSTAETVVA